MDIRRLGLVVVVVVVVGAVLDKGDRGGREEGSPCVELMVALVLVLVVVLVLVLVVAVLVLVLLVVLVLVVVALEGEFCSLLPRLGVRKS